MSLLCGHGKNFRAIVARTYPRGRFLNCAFDKLRHRNLLRCLSLSKARKNPNTTSSFGQNPHKSLPPIGGSLQTLHDTPPTIGGSLQTLHDALPTIGGSFQTLHDALPTIGGSFS